MPTAFTPGALDIRDEDSALFAAIPRRSPFPKPSTLNPAAPLEDLLRRAREFLGEKEPDAEGLTAPQRQLFWNRGGMPLRLLTGFQQDVEPPLPTPPGATASPPPPTPLSSVTPPTPPTLTSTDTVTPPAPTPLAGPTGLPMPPTPLPPLDNLPPPPPAVAGPLEAPTAPTSPSLTPPTSTSPSDGSAISLIANIANLLVKGRGVIENLMGSSGTPGSPGVPEVPPLTLPPLGSTNVTGTFPNGPGGLSFFGPSDTPAAIDPTGLVLGPTSPAPGPNLSPGLTFGVPPLEVTLPELPTTPPPTPIDEFGAGVDAVTAAPQAGSSVLENLGKILPWLSAGKGLLDVGQIAAGPGSSGDKAARAANAAAMTAGNFFGLGIPSVVDTLVQLFGGPSEAQIFADIFGIGPSKEWLQFPGKVSAGGDFSRSELASLAEGIARARTAQEIRDLVAAYKSDIAHGVTRESQPAPGRFGGVGGYGAGSGVYDLPELPEFSGRVHGVDVGTPPPEQDPNVLRERISGLERGQLANLGYQNLLGRVGSPDELQPWMNAPAGDIYRGIAGSQERAGRIQDLYQWFLGRGASPEEARDKALSEASIPDLTEEFERSPERLRRVSDLYESVLGRPGTVTEETPWAQSMKSLQQIENEIRASEESRARGGRPTGGANVPLSAAPAAPVSSSTSAGPNQPSAPPSAPILSPAPMPPPSLPPPALSAPSEPFPPGALLPGDPQFQMIIDQLLQSLGGLNL